MRSNVVTTLLRPAVWGVWGLLLITSDAPAQSTVPGAPTIDTVTAGRNTSGLTLTVTWTAPTNTGGSAITAYDVRHIKTAADETNDANWTEEDDAWTTGGGALTYTIAGLPESTEYDVQVRAVNATGDGNWSSTATGTTSDHGDMASTATALPLDTPQDSGIEPGTDVDYFTFTLTQETGLLIWTAGALDTVGELQDSSGTVLASNDDTPFSEDDPLSSAPSNFFLWKTLAAGTYSIKVSSYGGATGAYVLRTRAIVDSSGTADAKEITLDSDGIAVDQSGIGVISGWVCEADEVVIEIDGQPIAAAAGTERADTLDRCGDMDNGFGLLVNWAEFGAGAHEVVALVDGVELSRATVTVTMVDEAEPFVRGLTQRVEVADFPTPDETVTLAWQERQQNFVITGVR